VFSFNIKRLHLARLRDPTPGAATRPIEHSRISEQSLVVVAVYNWRDPATGVVGEISRWRLWREIELYYQATILIAFRLTRVPSASIGHGEHIQADFNIM
jgi:hypothetical protein